MVRSSLIATCLTFGALIGEWLEPIAETGRPIAPYLRRDSQRGFKLSDQRKHPRTDVDDPARLSFDGIHVTCVIRNISAEGAAIEVENAAYLPERFKLVTLPDQAAKNCRLIWIKTDRVGVAFED